MPIDEGRGSLHDDAVDVYFSRRVSTRRLSDVGGDIGVTPIHLPHVVSKDAVEPLAVPVVALTRLQVNRPPVDARPVNVDPISRAAVYPDLLSGRVKMLVDSGNHSGKSLDDRPVGGMTVLEPLEYAVLEIAPGDGLIRELSIFDPFKHSVLQEASDVQPARVQSGLGPLELSGLDVMDDIHLDGGHLNSLVWITALDDRSTADITVLELIEHSVLDVDTASQWMAPWDAGGTFRNDYRSELDVCRDILCGDVQSARKPVFPAVGYMGYVGDLSRTCVIDLYAGVAADIGSSCD